MKQEMDGREVLEEMEEAKDNLDFELPIQHHSRPMSRISGDLAMRTNTTMAHLDDIDVDRNLTAVARNLGVEIPEEPVEKKVDAASPNISAVTVLSTFEDPSIVQSRASNSTRPTSVDSDEDLTPETPKPTHIPIESLFPADIPLPLSAAPSRATSRAPSLAPSRTPSYSRAPSIAPSTVADSITSATRSVFSVANISKHSSVASSFTKSLRRLSAFSRRKSVEPLQSTQSQVQIQAVNTPQVGFLRSRAISAPQLRRPSTADGVKPQSGRSPSVQSVPITSPPTYYIPRKVMRSVPDFQAERNGRGMIRRPLTPTIEEEDIEEMMIAQERSLRNSHLKKLRAIQLEEQARFLQEHFTKQRKAKDETGSRMRKAREVYSKRRDDTTANHETANTELEMRHLNAELELERSLSSQRKACETKLKYMEAYCNGGRESTEPRYLPDEKNYPARRVTEEDYRKLVEQYHLRNGMDTLHKSRINVLREQQAQQANRITIRQDGELEGLSKRHERESLRLQTDQDRIELDLQRDYTNKKSRLIWRWKVKEAIERRRLELDRGQIFGELPDVTWPEEYRDTDDKIILALGQGERFSFLMS